ncbi:MFS transporter [Acetobacter lovaniensis]|uniref:DHA1 family L-arabinose/isopropyl-beta-D-thiogalactopyranoside export protein-like MFS transporter n=1 Tax=Acetobacter lovaniensis TaxID=104100 RepID=A0A841QDT8_9PROT|nr:MFS transporter [Acetobacter lovaniensis]MBB6456393.1 DHA1 family L-arabinose/isopropyl-beta-D-thiogalactopyranoside export protein-like MFS transporter [Acetobacter lovaniensis]NHN80759.1 MFS transporter [Acetobacter lovaniensis]GBQ73766.1 arabinose efflux permease [Acetobacter lovaniensis NRIC 0474]
MVRLVMLSVGAFIWLVTEVMPIGLLTDIAQGLHVSPAQVGLLVTGYAWLVALTAIPLTLLTSGVDRRVLVASLLLLAGGVDVACAFVTNYALMAVLRIMLALGHGIFWSVIAGVAVRLAPDIPVARATGWAFTGVAVGFAGGIPLVSAIGQWLGWRAAFLTCGAGALAVFAAALMLLPAMPAQRRRLDLLRLLRQPVFVYIAVLTMLVIIAHFTAYTYIIPLLQTIPHSPERLIPVLLLVYGVAGVGGNWVGGRLPCSAGRLIGMATAALVASHGVMVAAGWWPGLVWVDMVVWGIVGAVMNMAPQSYAMELAPDEREAACSFSVTGFNAGIGGGALCGGVVLGAAGPYAVLAWSAGIALLALLVLWAGRFVVGGRKQG